MGLSVTAFESSFFVNCGGSIDWRAFLVDSRITVERAAAGVVNAGLDIERERDTPGGGCTADRYVKELIFSIQRLYHTAYVYSAARLNAIMRKQIMLLSLLLSLFHSF